MDCFASCKLSLKCSSNGDFTKINSNDQLDLIGSCLTGCDSSSTYTFNLYAFSSGSGQWILFINSSYYFTSGKSNTGFSILKNLFTDNPSLVIWKVELIVSVASAQTTNQTFQGTTSMKIMVNFPPIPGICDVNPKKGNTTNIFYITCDTWTDLDGNVEKYSFYGKYFT